MPGCRRCGQCCNRASVILHHVTRGRDDLEFQSFLEHHRVETAWLRITDDGPEHLAVKLPLTCKHLDQDPETGLAKCLIYDRRPEFCRVYFCGSGG